MSRDWINIRIGTWHIMIGPWSVRLVKNRFHAGYPEGFFKVYRFMGK